MHLGHGVEVTFLSLDLQAFFVVLRHWLLGVRSVSHLWGLQYGYNLSRLVSGTGLVMIIPYH